MKHLDPKGNASQSFGSWVCTSLLNSLKIRHVPDIWWLLFHMWLRHPVSLIHCSNTVREVRDMPEQFEGKYQGITLSILRTQPSTCREVDDQWMLGEWRSPGSLQGRQVHSLSRIRKDKGFRMKEWQILFNCSEPHPWTITLEMTMTI